MRYEVITGTPSGNPVAMAAGLATLEGVDQPGFHERLAARTRHLVEGLAHAAKTPRMFMSGCAPGCCTS